MLLPNRLPRSEVRKNISPQLEGETRWDNLGDNFNILGIYYNHIRLACILRLGGYYTICRGVQHVVMCSIVNYFRVGSKSKIRSSWDSHGEICWKTVVLFWFRAKALKYQPTLSPPICPTQPLFWKLKRILPWPVDFQSYLKILATSWLWTHDSDLNPKGTSLAATGL